MNFVRGDETEIELWAQKGLKNAIKKSTIVPEAYRHLQVDIQFELRGMVQPLWADHLLIMRQGENFRILMMKKLYRKHTSGVRAGLKVQWPTY